MAIRTNAHGRVYHGEDAARTDTGMWVDGDVFIVQTTGASYVWTNGAWVQISVGTGTTDHNSLSNFDGGTTNEYYHLTAAQHTDLTDGGDTTLHAHNAYIANSLLTTRGDLLVRNATVPDRLGLTVPSAPTLNYLGVANGETQPSWKSASSAPGAAAAVLQTKADGQLEIGAVLHITGDTYPTTGAGLELGGNSSYSVIESINRDTSTGMPIYFNYGITGDMIFNAGASLGNIQLGDTQNRSGTVSTKSINIFNGTAPVGTLANGITLYSSGGKPYVMDALGTARNLIDDYIANALTSAKGDLIIASAANTPARYGVVAPASPSINVLGVANGEDTPTWKPASAAGAADAHILATDASGYTRVVRLGIGTSPSYGIHIVGSTAANTLILVERTGGVQLIYQANSTVDGRIGTVTDHPLHFLTNNAIKATINATGQFLGSNGSVVAGNAPGIAFLSYADSGVAANADNLVFWESGTIALAITTVLKQFRLPSDFLFSWSSATNNNSAADTELYRNSAGVLRTDGALIIDGGLIVNDDGGAAGDLRAESDTEPNMLLLDASADVLYLGGTTGVKIYKGGKINAPLTDYANNAAAITGGLSAGDFYTETGTNPKRVCVVY